MALAGSSPRGRTDLEDRALGQALLEDPKERSEHAFVVEALRSNGCARRFLLYDGWRQQEWEASGLQEVLDPRRG